MKSKALLSLAIAMTLGVPEIGHAQPLSASGNGRFWEKTIGCTDLGSFVSLGKTVYAADATGMESMMAPRMASKACRIFKTGRATLVQRMPKLGVSCVKGEVDQSCYWVAEEAFTPDAPDPNLPQQQAVTPVPVADGIVATRATVAGADGANAQAEVTVTLIDVVAHCLDTSEAVHDLATCVAGEAKAYAKHAFRIGADCKAKSLMTDADPTHRYQLQAYRAGTPAQALWKASDGTWLSTGGPTGSDPVAERLVRQYAVLCPATVK